MNKVLKYVFLFSLVYASLLSLAQNEAKKWYFGDYAALDFMTNPPTVLANSSMSTTGNKSASMANSAGNLLFYTNGTNIWNQSNSIMANGMGVSGGTTLTQPVIILKQPGNASLFYVFTINGTLTTGAGLDYSVVDMSLAGGQGSVTVKNIPVYTGTCSAKLTATKHCNGVDYWVVIRDMTNNFAMSNFRSFLFSAAGVNTVAVVSPGSILPYPLGSMKISPNGKKVGVASRYATPGGIINTFELHDFDNSTGIVSNSLGLLPVNTSTNFNSGGTSVEFSPDGTKLYGTRNNVSGVFGDIYQWDLCAGSGSAIAASQFMVPTSTNPSFCHLDLQLASNGKIYIATGCSNLGLQRLGVINNPNVAGAGCSFVDTVVATGTSWAGLPNFMSSYFLKPPPITPFIFTVGNNASCQLGSFTAPPPPSITCAASGFSLNNVLWNFGDPASGVNNTSALINPTHAFTSLGSYTVQLILYYTCGGGTDTLRQVVNVTQPCITVNSTSITCATRGSATVSPLPGAGPFSYTWMPGGQTASVATGLSPGTYTITVLNTNNNTIGTATVLFTSAIPLTGNLNNSSSITCYSANTGTANYSNLAGGSPNQNYLWTNGLSTLTVANPTTLGAGLWSVTVTDALTGCTIKDLFFVTQPPPSTLNISSTTPTACAGSSAVLSGTIIGGPPGYSYSWANGPPSSTFTASKPLAGTYVYSLTGTDANSCTTTNTISLDFVPNPTLSLASIQICPLAYGSLTVTGAGSYTWSDNSNGSMLVDNPLVNTSYSVVGMSAAGCTASAQGFIILKSKPVPVFTSNSPLCEGLSLQLGVTTASLYNWAGPNGFFSSIKTPTITNVPLLNAGVYDVTVTATNGCTAATSGTVVVKPIPSLTVTPSSPSICLNTTSTTLNASGTATLFSWSPAQGLSGVTGGSVLANPGITKTYTVIGSLNGCTNVASAVVNVVAAPNLLLLLSSTVMCAQAFNGSPNTITMTSTGANTYTLLTPNYIAMVNANGTLNPVNTLPPYTLGMATATLLGSNGVCTLSITRNFSVIPNPTVGINSYTPVICAGESYTYTANGADSYTWSPANPGSTLYTSGQFAVANASINSLFSVFGSSLGCFSPIRTSTLTVVQLPTVVINPNNPEICLGNKITLTANGNGSSYFWSPLAGLNSQNGVNVIANPTSNQSFTVVASANNCSSSAVVTVTVLPLPVPVIEPSSTMRVCLNSVAKLQGSGGKDYFWEGPGKYLYAGQTVTFVADNLDYGGVYFLTVTDTKGCSARTSSIITVDDLPNGSLVFDKLKGCVPFCSEFYFIPANNASIVSTWLPGHPERSRGVIPLGQVNNRETFRKCFDTPGDSFIRGKLKDKETNCENVLDFYVTAYEKPEADFTWLPEHPIEGMEEVVFVNSSVGEEQNLWAWSFRIPNQDPDLKSGPTVNYRYDQAGLYTIAYVVKNKWNCVDTIVKSIKVETDFGVYVPNVFSPNGDDLNDVFLPIVSGTKKYNLQIFNRWGQQLFQTFEPGKGWDGNYQGEAAKQDSYIYKLKVSSVVGVEKVFEGTVVLIR